MTATRFPGEEPSSARESIITVTLPRARMGDVRPRAPQDSFALYLREIGGHPLIGPEEERRLARRIRAGDRRALDRMVESNLRFVVSVAKRYLHLGVPLQDLVTEGNLGLLEAAERFDEKSNNNFKLYSYIRVKGAMIDWMRTFLPGKREFGKRFKMRVDPSLDQLTDTRDAGGETFGSSIGADGQATKVRLWADVEAALTPREFDLIRATCLDGSYLRDWGEANGISESRACQIRKLALAKLRKALVSFDGYGDFDGTVGGKVVRRHAYYISDDIRAYYREYNRTRRELAKAKEPANA